MAGAVLLFGFGSMLYVAVMNEVKLCDPAPVGGTFVVNMIVPVISADKDDIVQVQFEGAGPPLVQVGLFT